MTEIRSTLDRFFAKVNKTETCWLWTGCINKAKGYGRFWDGERTRGAHRVGYELLRGCRTCRTEAYRRQYAAKKARTA